MSLIMDSAMAKNSCHSAPVGRPIIAGTIPRQPVSMTIGRRRQRPPQQMRSQGSRYPNATSDPDCLVCGLPNKSIARELNITEATVKVYVKGLLRKIKVSNRTQVAIWLFSSRTQLGTHQAVAAMDTLAPSVRIRQPIGRARLVCRVNAWGHNLAFVTGLHFAISRMRPGTDAGGGRSGSFR